jgi:hypothetical protein
MRGLAILAILLMCSLGSFAYSVLTHEEIVDLLWTAEIRPLLLKRFPGLSEDQLREAHAYAYGGAVIQDLGYYPFGRAEFSNLVHYVRSGDFVRELRLESQDANEYAFALGALAHYASDIAGHPAVNQAVAVYYPKLRAKYGKSVKYAQDKTAHLKTEFGFDMVQVAKNRYASEQYHDFIGFKVSKPLLERVFPVVYGVELKDALPHADLAIGSYRFCISRLIPEMTQVALRTHKKDMTREMLRPRNESSCTGFRAPITKRSGERTTRSPDSASGSCQRSCATFRKLAPSRRWRSRTLPRKQRSYISRASMRPSINTGLFSNKYARMSSWFPIVIWMMAKGPRQGNTR